jgi:Glycosyl hydrolases family 2
MPALDQLDVFYGELTVNRACVYARLPRPDGGELWSLTGQVRGPRCLHAQTLPVSAKLVDQGPGPTLLARAILPDPCFWWPDLPAIYDVTIELRQGTEVVASARRELGLRSLGIRGRNLVLNGKPWVLRGVSTYATTERLPRAWHEASAAYVCEDSDLEPLAEASQWGALSVVHFDQPADQATRRLRELARHPGVAIAVVLGQLPADFRKSQVAPNLLLADHIGLDNVFTVEPWADLLFVTADGPDHLHDAVAAEKPVVITRYLEPPVGLGEARAACDTLQRDLAPLGQFAGYIV